MVTQEDVEDQVVVDLVEEQVQWAGGVGLVRLVDMVIGVGLQVRCSRDVQSSRAWHGQKSMERCWG